MAKLDQPLKIPIPLHLISEFSQLFLFAMTIIHFWLYQLEQKIPLVGIPAGQRFEDEGTHSPNQACWVISHKHNKQHFLIYILTITSTLIVCLLSSEASTDTHPHTQIGTKYKVCENCKIDHLMRHHHPYTPLPLTQFPPLP